ncbi:hypothetical protein HJFPF1_05602 [Paramyrothecium foliicola]|nr:hypothetical protein HJFPF1_05602 [Paramyrothecium foliicola]
MNDSGVNSSAFEPNDLVRQFSYEIENRQQVDGDTAEYDQLRQDFVGERHRRERRYQDDIDRIEAHFNETETQDAVCLDKAKDQLILAMKKFQEVVPNSLKTTELPRSWDDVWSVANEAQSLLEAKAKESHAGRAKSWIRKMCNGMNNHSMALKMLPSESEYVSLVAGSVGMIIKAAANYINISESFAKGIIEINDAVKLEHLSHVYDAPGLRQLTMRLYAQIFTYLIKFMTWYTDRSRKRFLKSFNENIQRLFEDDLKEIKQISTLISRRVQLHMSVDTRTSKLLLENLNDDMQYLLKFAEVGTRDSQLREATNARLLQSAMRSYLEKSKEELRECLRDVMKEYTEITRSEVSGQSVNTLLQQQAYAENDIFVQTSVLYRESNAAFGMSNVSGLNIDAESGRRASFQGFRLDFETRHLEDYFSWEDVNPQLDTSLPLLAEAAFVARLDTFTNAMESQVLYAFIQHHHADSNLLQQSAWAYATLARQAGVPVISYFCSLHGVEPTDTRTRESVQLTGLLYAMIRQLVDLAPDDLASQNTNVTWSRFANLDGTTHTLQDAIYLLEQLLQCTQLPMLLFVIDGLNVLENDSQGSTDEALDELVRCLNGLSAPGAVGSERIMKMLFTTSGISDVLYKQLAEEDIIICSRGTSRRGGRLQAGRQTVSY